MYELINLSANNLPSNSWYIQSPANIGLFKTENDGVILIDSGNDKDAAKKFFKKALQILKIRDKKLFNYIVRIIINYSHFINLDQ